MSFTITKEFTFEASHRLTELPEGHPCARHHGHSYRVVFVLTGDTLNHIGFLRDYHEMDVVKAFIDGALDHRHLNDVLPCNPTAENIACYLFERFKPVLPELSAVRVSETQKTWAEYHAPEMQISL